MQLSPYTTAFFAVFFDFPFAFTKDLQPGGINHQMRDFTPGERFETDINRLCALADTGVIRAAQRNIHQCYGATVDEGFIVGGPVGDFELLLCHGTVCVVGKMRDLILQLSKSSIYSTKPRMASEPSETNAIPAMEALTAR